MGHVPVDEKLVEQVGLVVVVEGPVGQPEVGPHEVPQPGRFGLDDVTALPGAQRVGDETGVEGLVVEVTHRERGGVGSVELEGAFVEVGEGFAGDVAIAGGFGLAAAAGGPVVAEDRPGASLGGLEVDLDDLAGGVASHHDMEEHFLLRAVKCFGS